MKVILLENIPKIGQKGDVKDLKEGFVRNSLLPQKKVKIATTSDLNNLKKKNQKREEYENAELQRVRNIFKKIETVTIEIEENKNEKGHLFAKVDKKEVIDAVYKKLNLKIEGEWFELEPIKEVGDYTINLKYKNLDSKIKIKIK